MSVIKTVEMYQLVEIFNSDEVVEGNTFGTPLRSQNIDAVAYVDNIIVGTLTAAIQCSLDGENWTTIGSISELSFGGGLVANGFMSMQPVGQFIRVNCTANDDPVVMRVLIRPRDPNPPEVV